MSPGDSCPGDRRPLDCSGRVTGTRVGLFLWRVFDRLENREGFENMYIPDQNLFPPFFVYHQPCVSGSTVCVGWRSLWAWSASGAGLSPVRWVRLGVG